MGTRTNAIHVLRWQRTLAEMKAHGTRVRLMGCGCANWSEVDMDALIGELGPSAHLWDERRPCPVCGKAQHFMASPGGGTPFTPMKRQQGRELLGL